METITIPIILEFLKTQPLDKVWNLNSPDTWVTATYARQLLGDESLISHWDGVTKKKRKVESDIFGTNFGDEVMAIDPQYQQFFDDCISDEEEYDQGDCIYNKDLIMELEMFMK